MFEVMWLILVLVLLWRLSTGSMDRERQTREAMFQMMERAQHNTEISSDASKSNAEAAKNSSAVAHELAKVINDKLSDKLSQ
jgi:hypothetical protein